VLSWTNGDAIAHLVVLLLAVLGIVFAFSIVAIVGRNAAWQRACILTARSLQKGEAAMLFAEDAVEREHRAPYSSTPVLGVIRRARNWVVGAWAVFIAVVIAVHLGVA
jgi:hypothetical protein